MNPISFESRPIGVETNKLVDVYEGVQRKESEGDEIVKLVNSKLAVERRFNFQIELGGNDGLKVPVFRPPELLNDRID